MLFRIKFQKTLTWWFLLLNSNKRAFFIKNPISFTPYLMYNVFYIDTIYCCNFCCNVSNSVLLLIYLYELVFFAVSLKSAIYYAKLCLYKCLISIFQLPWCVWSPGRSQWMGCWSCSCIYYIFCWFFGVVLPLVFDNFLIIFGVNKIGKACCFFLIG